MAKTGGRSLQNRILGYQEKMCRLFGIPVKSGVHLGGGSDIRFLHPYTKKSEWHTLPAVRRIHARRFWDFIHGDRRHYRDFCWEYRNGIAQMLWLVKATGKVEIAAVPKSSPGRATPLAEVCRDVAESGRFALARPLNGSDLLLRKQSISSRFSGSVSEQEQMASLIVSRPLRSDTVVLLDDLVYSGRTIKACRRVLREAGAVNVYALCMYGYRREKG